jgi:hypothetical protein
VVTLSYKGRRDKGIRGEREVRERLTKAGLDVRGLEGLGDHLASKRRGAETILLHIEVKRQETLQPDRWSRQAETEAPEGAAPIVVYRRDREPWRVLVTLDEFLRLLG